MSRRDAKDELIAGVKNASAKPTARASDARKLAKLLGSQAAAAKACGMKQPAYSDLLTPLRVSKQLWGDIDDRRLNQSVVRIIAGQPEEAHVGLAERILRDGLSANELRELVGAGKRTKKRVSRKPAKQTVKRRVQPFGETTPKPPETKESNTKKDSDLFDLLRRLPDEVEAFGNQEITVRVRDLPQFGNGERPVQIPEDAEDLARDARDAAEEALRLFESLRDS